jgi:hypothetical protein
MIFGRMLTKNKYFIGSKWIHKNNDWARINYTVRVSIVGFKIFTLELLYVNLFLTNFF